MAAARFFADVLWNTSVLPTTIVVGGTTYTKQNPDGTPLPASINGVESRSIVSPEDKDQMIQSINQNISFYCYKASFAPYPYNCLTNVYNGVTYPGLIPSRYITMGPGSGAGSADKLEVNGVGEANATYETTDIRTPPF
jgi:hypothetical protein